MATLDLIEAILHRPAGAPHLGVGVACLLLAATAMLGPDGARAVAERVEPVSGRDVAERGRRGAGPTLEGTGERGLVREAGEERDIGDRAARREVADVDTATTRLIDAGAGRVAPPTETPWRSRNSRLEAPGPVHLTLFQELDTGAQS